MARVKNSNKVMLSKSNGDSTDSEFSNYKDIFLNEDVHFLCKDSATRLKWISE